MPDRNQDPIRVYVPHPESLLTKTIDHGSGIVGIDADNGRVLIYYEGNRFAARSLRRYVERVRHADGRLSTDYPTIAKANVDAREIIPVGWWHRAECRLELEVTPAELSWWVNSHDIEEILCKADQSTRLVQAPHRSFRGTIS